MFLELAKKRRSCREYSQNPVPREMIEKCLEAARLAPSACNSQPWYFVVVDSPELKDALGMEAFSGIYSMNSFAKEAPVLVVYIREKSKSSAVMGGLLRGVHYNFIDEGTAITHFILQAAELGLGSCWLGWFNEKAVKKVLKLPASKRIDSMISLGFPSNTASEAIQKPRKQMNEIRDYR
ncbi:MAG: nitroreductase family protein [Candidatus Omnitrophica bacterium]|nr:nitroreductase family protein [Candidatus Omnitrophota bacterium]